MVNLYKIVFDFFAQYQIAVERYEFTIQYNLEKIVDECESDGLMKTIMQESNVIDGPQPSAHFHFQSDLEQTNTDFFIFATDHGACDYGVELVSKKIALLEVITGDFFFYIAKHEESFLMVLSKMLEFENYYRQRIKVDGTLTRRIRQECIDLAGGPDYAKFYENIIISEDDMPLGPFTLP